MRVRGGQLRKGRLSHLAVALGGNNSEPPDWFLPVPHRNHVNSAPAVNRDVDAHRSDALPTSWLGDGQHTGFRCTVLICCRGSKTGRAQRPTPPPPAAFPSR